MKLQTSIQPRRDGTVRVLGKDSQTYVFAAGPEGDLTCDVTDEATIAFLLAGGLFWPANPDDFPVALELTKQDDEPDDEPDEADEADDEVLSALPVEAETPPVRKRAPRKVK